LSARRARQSTVTSSVSGCIHIDTSTGYGYPSAGYSKHEFARIPMAAFTFIQVHYEFDFNSYGLFCAGLVSRQPARVGM